MNKRIRFKRHLAVLGCLVACACAPMVVQAADAKASTLKDKSQSTSSTKKAAPAAADLKIPASSTTRIAAAQPATVTNTAVPAEDDAVSDLLRVLDEETDIATKTKLNIDFVPGMVTVLHGKDLLAKGVRTVYGALGLVPGIELSMTGDGQPQFLVRGMGKTFASTKIKFLVNGVDVNSTLGPAMVVRTIPIEQVDRIEVIRGPGSAIYGEYALAGVVDVITLDHGKNAFARYGTGSGVSLGGLYSSAPPDSKFSYSLNIAATSSDGADQKAGNDKLWGTPYQAISNAPGSVNDSEQNRSAMLKMRYSDVTFFAQHVRAGFGDHFGVNDVLPDENNEVVRSWTFDTIELRAPRNFCPDVRADVRVGWTHFVAGVDDQQLYPANWHGEFPGTGVLGSPHYEEVRTSLKMALEFPIAEAHKGLVGIEYAAVRQGDTYNKRNFDPTILSNPNNPPPSNGGQSAQVPYVNYTGDENWLQESLKRHIAALYMQDEFTGVENLSITAGLRIDHYDDVGDSASPRIAGVYHLSQSSTFKAQYSDSFRPPSFLEMYTQNNPIVNGNPDIKPETMHNLEAGYIYNTGEHVFRLTAFSSRIHNIIIVDSVSHRYENGGDAQFRGIEAEFVAPLMHRVKLDGNVSYQISKASEGTSQLWGAARLYGNLGALYQLRTDRFVNVQYRYVGPRDRESDDTRSSLAAYQTFDVTYSAEKTKYRGLSFRGGIKNVFNVDVVFPALKKTYPDDYPRPGREVWVAAGFDF